MKKVCKKDLPYVEDLRYWDIYDFFKVFSFCRYQVNNLFQLSNGKWQANLRKDEQCYDFGEGETPELALRNCLRKLLKRSIASKIK